MDTVAKVVRDTGVERLVGALQLRATAKDEAARLGLGFLPFDERYPGLAAWMSRIEALPGYDKTYPPHWK